MVMNRPYICDDSDEPPVSEEGTGSDFADLSIERRRSTRWKGICLWPTRLGHLLSYSGYSWSARCWWRWPRSA